MGTSRFWPPGLAEARLTPDHLGGTVHHNHQATHKSLWPYGRSSRAASFGLPWSPTSLLHPSGTPAPQPLKLLGVILLCSSTNHCLTASVNLQAPWKGYNFSTRPRGAPRKAKASALCTGTVDGPRAWGPATHIAPESVACFQPPMDLWAPKQCGILSIPSPLTHKASTTFSGLHGRHLSLPENNRS